MMEIEINKENYQELVVDNPAPTVVDFWGPKCVRCMELMPTMEQIATQNENKMRLIKIDATKNRRLCMSLRLMSLPAFLFYRDGKEIGRLSGDNISEEQLRESVGKLIAGEEVL